MALINSSPELCQSKLEITIFVLVGCLGYSNSAINPLLYAFLSDNFKKSFMKACLCARSNDFNGPLHVENSIFPRFGRSRGSEKLTSIAKNNFNKTKTSTAAGGGTNVKDSEGAVVFQQDKCKNNVFVKTTAITIPCIPENKENNNINGHNETTNTVQRTAVLHTDL
ncbi:CLUMA_CG007223, isoform A [Clunio marinus]|uniref:CLUMA_CG007223, isoform A n=1 Tax=Clunio marinus TaxID=568069 RepID=A0A1J1I015_9DIPT|nr:CLUMA_CG007223, isoform A [Clunio marinus]